MINSCFIGLDCGATHTKVCVWKNGEKLYEADNWPGMNMDLLNDGGAVELFKNELVKVLQFENYLWVIALAGVDNKEEVNEAILWWKRFLTSSLVKYTDIKVLSDIDLVLWAGSTDGSGVGVIAGTGSNGIGKDSKGKVIKVGGMSHLMSDEGSGFALGWNCLRLVTKMSDGRMPKTKLFQDVLGLYGMKTLVDLKNYLLKSRNLKFEIARISPLILEAAESGDQEAAEIVDIEAGELFLMVETINRQLSPTNTFPVFLAGSLFNNDYYRNKFVELLHESYPTQKISQVHPIEGVVNFVNSL